MSAFEFLKESAKSVVTTAKVWPTISKATADEEAPTPGYVLDELARMAWESDDVCAEVLGSLIKKLEKDSPYVKVKALRCIRYIIMKGPETFHRDLQRRADPIRDATQYRGVPDPLRGDANNKAVRDVATELLPLVFSGPSSIRREPPAPLREPGLGSSSSSQLPQLPVSGGATYVPPRAISSGSGGGSGGAPPANALNPDGSKKMWGYANPNYHEPPPSIMDRVKDAVVDALTTPAPAPAGRPHGPTGSSGARYQPPNTYEDARHSRPSLSTSEDFEQRRPGQVGGGWGSAPLPSLAAGGQRPAPPPAAASSAHPVTATAIAHAVDDGEEEDEEDEEDDDPSSSMPALTPTATQPVARATPTPAAAAPPAAAGVLEQRLVDDLTVGGVRTNPSTEALNAFCQRCRTLNLAYVAAALRTRLADDNWQTQMGVVGRHGHGQRALYVTEALLVQNVQNASDVLVSTASALSALRASSKPALQTKADKVLMLLGVEPVGAFESSAPAPPTASVPAAAPVNRSTAAATLPQTTPSALSHSFDFLGLGPETAEAPTPAAPSVGSLLDGFESAAPAGRPASTAAPASGYSNDLLLDFGGGSGSATSAQSTGGAGPASSLEELLGLTTAPTSYSAPTVQSTGAWRPLPSAYAAPPGSQGQGYRSSIPATGTPMPGYPPAAYPSALAGYPAPVMPAAATTQASWPLAGAAVTIDPNLVGRGRDAPNYNVSGGTDKRTASSSSFNFVGEKRDAFEFVQEEIRRK